ncbi:hypothetical protein ACIQUM_31770 [Amycolatopsis azurea]|uniref:hypothetical protein n=1 Tax=Amycolatopsis azurea TaxID=36819 RepID=UPI0037F894E3
MEIRESLASAQEEYAAEASGSGLVDGQRRQHDVTAHRLKLARVLDDGWTSDLVEDRVLKAVTVPAPIPRVEQLVSLRSHLHQLHER